MLCAVEIAPWVVAFAAWVVASAVLVVAFAALAVAGALVSVHPGGTGVPFGALTIFLPLVT